jgi:hypothetical protein
LHRMPRMLTLNPIAELMHPCLPLFTLTACVCAAQQEESWRLQQQSKALQQRAMEMSYQVGVPGVPCGTPGDMPAYAAAPLLPQQRQANPYPCYQEPHLTQAPLTSDSLSQLVSSMPAHLPGEMTPSSTTSSRAALHWNLPGGRGGSPSPFGGAYSSDASYLNSTSTSRCAESQKHREQQPKGLESCYEQRLLVPVTVHQTDIHRTYVRVYIVRMYIRMGYISLG